MSTFLFNKSLYFLMILNVKAQKFFHIILELDSVAKIMIKIITKS